MVRVARVLAGVLASAALLVALAVLSAYTWLPGWARDTLQRAATEATGRATTIGRVEIEPFRLRAIVHDLAVARADGSAAQLAVPRIEATLSIASLRHRAPVVDALAIVDPSLRLARVAPNRYDVQDVLDRLADAPPGPPPKFSLNNVALTGGTIEFDDRPAKRVHRVERLALGIPFVSSLPHEVAIDVQPHVDAIVNGTRFALAGDATPFAQTRAASLALDLDALPIASYVDYVPARLRFVLASGSATTRLRLTFAQAPGEKPSLLVAGDVTIDDVAARRRDGAPLVSAARIAIAIDRVDPATRSAAVARVAIERPRVVVRRLPDGSAELAQPWVERVAPSPDGDPRWRIEVREASVRDGTLHVEDVAVAPAYRADWNALSVRATGLSSERGAKARVEASFRIDDRATSTLAADLTIAPFALGGRFEVAGADLARLYPYAATALAVEIRQGTIDAAMTFDLATEPATTLRFSDGRAVLRDTVLAAPGEREPLWRVPELAAEGIAVDVPARTVSLGRATVRRPALVVRRDADGEWNFARLVRTSATTGAAPPDGAGADSTWQLSVARADVERGDIRVEDRTTNPPVAIRFTELGATAEGLGNARGRRGSVGVGTRVGERGRLALRGALATNPVAADLQVRASDVALVPLRPYVEANTGVSLVGGTASANGRLAFGPGTPGAGAFSWTGDVRLDDVDVLDRAASADLVRWRTLKLDRLAVRDEPLSVTVDAIALADFRARLVVQPDATLNLARLLSREDDTPPGPAPPPPAKPSGLRVPGPPAGAATRSGSAAPRAPTGKVAQAAESAQRTIRRVADGALPFAIGKIELAGGNVDFTDLYIRPNYSANLTGVAGTISALSPTQAGEVALTAKLDDGAPVEIRGTVQPFARELSLDLAANARDIELPPLSPYSGKYAGYGISKGKLSFDVSYKVEDRRLDARNRLVLDQLTFGDKVESPDATKLPVLLAVALLKDRNGRIDIELPVQGTLDDPRFSMFRVVVQIVVNLLTKAATAPFALLAGARGGGEELAYLEFAPGRDDVGPESQAKVDRLARALDDRPNLKVEIAGHVEPAADRAALEKAALESMIRNAQRKANREEAAEVASAKPMSPEERQRWLAAAYRDAPIKERPRNAIGMLKEVPPAEMEAMLIASAGIDDKAVQALAQRRAQHAKDALAKQGIAGERLFLVAPKSGAAAAARVDFALR